MARIRLRSRHTVVTRCHGLATDLRVALAKLPGHESDARVVDAIWSGEALGALLWGLTGVELPAYDTPFDHKRLVGEEIADPHLRPAAEIERARDTAQLWHWRARTATLQAEGSVELPEPWTSFDQLIAATAMLSFESGLLPAPVRGDFGAFGTAYKQLNPTQFAIAHSIALERHRALNWLCGLGSAWDDIPTDT